MIQFFKSLYFGQNFYASLFGFAVLFLLSFWFPALFSITWLILIGFLFVIAFEFVRLYGSNKFSAERILPEKFSNSDANQVLVNCINSYNFPIEISIIDEIPEQFQKRDFQKYLN